MTAAAGDAHPYPVYGARFRLIFPILDADGDLVAGASGLDSERSIDGGTFADCTNEATQIATSSGMYYLDLTGTETSAKSVCGITKTSTSGAKTTPWVLYPVRLPVLESGTAQSGASGSITLGSGASAVDNFYAGLFVLVTNNSPANVQGQMRRIISYVGSTRVATVEANWGTNPSSASTYAILIPEGLPMAAWLRGAVWDAATRTLTAGTNIALAKGTGVTGFTDLDAAGVRTAVGLASANLDTQLDALPTNSELSAALASADDAVLAAIGALLTANRRGTAQGDGGGSDTIQLDSEASEDDGYYNGTIIVILEGTGANVPVPERTRRIVDYVGSTKVATVDEEWGIAPDDDTVFLIFGAS